MQKETSGKKDKMNIDLYKSDLCVYMHGGTGVCLHTPFRLNPTASLAWLGTRLPMPAPEGGCDKSQHGQAFPMIAPEACTKS